MRSPDQGHSECTVLDRGRPWCLNRDPFETVLPSDLTSGPYGDGGPEERVGADDGP